MVSFRKSIFSFIVATVCGLLSTNTAVADSLSRDAVYSKPLVAKSAGLHADSLYISKNWRFQLSAYSNIYFDNKEYSRSNFQPSGTIFNTQLVPYVGFVHENPSGSETSIQFGVNINIGHGVNDTKPTFRMPIFITHKYKCFTGRFGIIPAKYFLGNPPTAMFSDDFLYEQSSINGVILNMEKEKFSYTLGLDWIGAYGPDNQRERFLVFSSGDHRVLDWMTVGYGIYYYHLACSEQILGVVDNGIVYPHVVFHALKEPWTLDFTVGYLQTLQRDRTVTSKFIAPGGGYAEQKFAWKGIFLKNTMYYGAGLMPYYSYTDNLGNPYGNLLYHGDPFYNFEGVQLYDRISVGYGRAIIPGLDFSVILNFHFHSKTGYSGCNQLFVFKFDGRIFR